jgi:hypothetical protein
MVELRSIHRSGQSTSPDSYAQQTWPFLGRTGLLEERHGGLLVVEGEIRPGKQMLGGALRNWDETIRCGSGWNLQLCGWLGSLCGFLESSAMRVVDIGDWKTGCSVR